MSDALAGAMIVLLIALGMYAGKLHERISGSGSKLKDKELEDAIKKVQIDLNSMSDTDLINAISKSGTVSKKNVRSDTSNTSDS